MISTPRKTGRRVGYYMCADGTRINGLTHTKSGLWRPDLEEMYESKRANFLRLYAEDGVGMIHSIERMCAK